MRRAREPLDRGLETPSRHAGLEREWPLWQEKTPVSMLTTQHELAQQPAPVGLVMVSEVSFQQLWMAVEVL